MKKRIIGIILALLLILAAFPSSLFVVDGEEYVILLYDGENKQVLGELTYANYKKMSSDGDIIYSVKHEFESNGVIFSVDGPNKTLLSDEDGTFHKIFAGWYIEMPTKLYPSSWNWSIENSIAGLKLFDKNGKPNEKLKYVDKKGKTVYRMFAYFVSAGYLDTVVSYRDTNKGDGKIDDVYFNSALPNPDMFESCGFVLSDAKEPTEKKLSLGKNALLCAQASSYSAVIQKPCYNFPIDVITLTGFDSNGFGDNGHVTSLYLKNIKAYPTLSVRAFWETPEGTVVYGKTNKVTLTDGSSLLPITVTN